MKAYTKEEFVNQKSIQPRLPEYKVKDLPSKGIFYPKGFSIKIRPYTYGEIKYISQSDIGLKDKIRFILEGVVTENLDKEDLTFYDFIFLGLLRRLYSFGTEELKITITCECGNRIEKVFVTEDIEFEDISVSSYKPIKVEYNGQILLIDVFRIKDILNSDYSFDSLSEEDQLAFHIKSLPFQQAKEFISNLIPFDLQELDKIISSRFFHYIKPFQIKCDKCGKINQVDLIDGVDLITPFRRSERTSSFRILDD